MLTVLYNNGCLAVWQTILRFAGIPLPTSFRVDIGVPSYVKSIPSKYKEVKFSTSNFDVVWTFCGGVTADKVAEDGTFR